MFVQLTKDFQGQKAGTRIDVTEADAKTLLEAGLAAKPEGDQLAPLIAKSMEGMLASISETMTKSIDAALKQVADAHTKSNKDKVKAIFGDAGEGDPNEPMPNIRPIFEYRYVCLTTSAERAIKRPSSPAAAAR